MSILNSSICIIIYSNFSLGETCSHVAATLYKIEAAVRYGLTAQTCTDVPCQWNQTFTTSVEAAPIADINFYTDTATKKISQTNRKREFSGAPNINKLLESISKKNNKVVGLSLFKDYQKGFISDDAIATVKKLPSVLTELYNPSHKSLNEAELYSKIETIIPTLIIKDEEANYLEQATRNQADSLVWHQHRIGRITGSVIYSLAHTSKQNPSKSLIKKICYQNTGKINTPAICWGREKESIALLAYFNALSDPDYVGDSLCINSSLVIHENFEMSECGLKVKQNEPWFGASPDSVVSCNCCGKGVVEVKCPFSCKDKSLQEVIKSKTFYIKKKGLFFELSNNHAYYYQVQHEMYVFGVSYCDFVVWTPKEFIVAQVPADNEFMKTLTNKCFDLWKTIILPELLCKSIEDETSTDTQAIRLYCKCQKPYDEKEPMIGCDKCDEWFHLNCLKLKAAPKAKKWYCSTCKSDKKKKI